MNVLIACEYSGTVRDAFSKRGHWAVSCDLIPSDKPGLHLIQDVKEVVDGTPYLRLQSACGLIG
jgi:hypothetical protein